MPTSFSTLFMISETLSDEMRSFCRVWRNNPRLRTDGRSSVAITNRCSERSNAASTVSASDVARVVGLRNRFGGLIDRLVHSDRSDALGHLERALERGAETQVVDRVVDHVDGADLDDLAERRVRLVLERNDDGRAGLLAVDRRQPA